MDKKAQKKIDVLRERLKKLQQLLANAKSQPDDLDEIQRLTQDIDSTEREIARLKSG